MQPTTSTTAKAEVFVVKAISVKVDREQQTPQEPVGNSSFIIASGLRFADESSSVIHAGITPPDDGSSAMSASDFKVCSPTRACQESQLSMTSPSSPGCGDSRSAGHYLYGRPFNIQTSGGSSNSTTIKTNLPLPIHSADEMTSTLAGATTDSEDSNANFPPPPPLAAAQQHHVHYIHHSHFQQDVGLPHYKLDTEPKLPTIFRDVSPSSLLCKAAYQNCLLR